MAVLQLSFRKTILNLHLRVQTTSKQLTISIFAPTIFRPTCMFTDKEDSGRGITTRKFSRGMKQEYHKTQRGQLHVFMEYASLGWLVKERNTLSWQFRTVVLAVEIDEPTTKNIRECGAKETLLSLILVIIASCLIFPINICEFFLSFSLWTANWNARGLCISMQGG